MSIKYTYPSVISPCFQDDHSQAARAPLPACEALFRAIVDAGSDLAELAPELSPYRPLAYRHSLPPDFVGAYVPVLTGEAEFHVGLLSDASGCDALTRVLQRPQSSNDLSVHVALSELARALVQRFLPRADPSLRLVTGPPVFIDSIARAARLVRAAEVAFGSIRATLTLAGWDVPRDRT
jgi:hypothetical protein